MDLPATAVFDYPTPKALAAFVLQLLQQQGPTVPEQAPGSLAHGPQLAGSNVMVVDAVAARLSQAGPAAVGDGFGVNAVPSSRWDADTSKASKRLGARFARLVQTTL